MSSADNLIMKHTVRSKQAEIKGAVLGAVIPEVVTKPVPYWQCETKSCADRLIHLKSSKAFTDVTLKFQPTGEIKAHSLVLAMTSPVFEKMFFGDFQKKNGEGEKVVEIGEVTFDTFQLLYSYIYGGVLQLETTREALELHKAAEMYLVDHLKEECINFMLENMTYKTAALVLDYAYFISNQILRTAALKLIKNNARKVLSKGYLNQANIDSVKAILEECRYWPCRVREIDLFTTLVDWTVNEVKSSEAEDLRLYWRSNALYEFIHFESVTPTEFGSCTHVGVIFDQSQCFDILRFLNGCGNQLPSILSSSATVPARDSLVLHHFPLSLDGVLGIFSRNSDQDDYVDCIINVKASFQMYLLGFRATLDDRIKVHMRPQGFPGFKELFKGNGRDIATGGKSVDFLFKFGVSCEADEMYDLKFTFFGPKTRNELNYKTLASGNKCVRVFGQGEMVAECRGCMPKSIGLSLIFKT